uniref:Uncharacterized protein n=1 Tax=Anopheles farauti TaxID=69004 RepID=A0A182Q6H9_9DIPT
MLSAPEKFGDRWSTLLQAFIGTNAPKTLHDAYDVNLALSCEYLLAGDDGQISVSNEHIEMQSMLNPTIMELFNDQVDDAATIEETTTDFPPTTCISDMFDDGDGLHLMDCQIELMDEFDLTDRIDFCPSYIECDDSLPAPEPEETLPKKTLVEITTKKAALKHTGRKSREKLTRGSYSVRKLMRILESNGVIFNRLQPASGSNTVNPSDVAPYEAIQCNLTFTRWLEFVIEQLNAIIDYNSDGKPPTQSFRIQEDFFHCLRARFSVGHHLRQPEPSEGDASDATEGRHKPLVFKFTHHKSLLHVFRTDRIELAFEKTFIRGSDGQFFPLERLKDDDNKTPVAVEGCVPIRPNRYSTYIKLGHYKHTLNSNRVHQFTVEWVGGVLPRSGFGDLRISFEYGHRMNNQYVPPPFC